MVAAVAPFIRDGLLAMLAGYMLILGIVWVLAIYRRLDYRFRGGVLLLSLYSIGLSELVNFGYGGDAISFLVTFSLLALLFFNRIIGAGALALSISTLAVVGWYISTGQFSALSAPWEDVSVSTVLTTCIIFLMGVGTVQVGLSTLTHHLYQAWQGEHLARMLLERERNLLEERVNERTQELARAHDQALAASRYEAEQKEYLKVLHQMTLDLIHRRDVNDLLQTIVERAAIILDAPYGELMLLDGDALVVRAFTNNQPFLLGDRVRRGEALLSWQAFDTLQPAILDDYSAWAGSRAIYASIPFRAVADFPILAGQHCIGVLAMGRVVPEHTFTPEDIQKGRLFSQLTAVVLDNAQLYTIALHEIAERKQAEQTLRQHAEDLQAQNAELDAFAHTVAHDLKNPLTSLVGYTQLLQINHRTMSVANVDALLDIISKTGYKMNAIIDELLLLASVRTLDTIPIEELAMGSIVAELDMRLHDLIEATGATIRKPETWPIALGYAPWVEEVWANYVSNAMKYGGNPPVVVLGATPMEGGSIRFWVQDNGLGLSADEQSRLFTPFTRLQTERIEGHGLGLSIVQRIIHKLGGEVGVSSELGHGSTFYFTLPAAYKPVYSPLDAATDTLCVPHWQANES